MNPWLQGRVEKLDPIISNMKDNRVTQEEMFQAETCSDASEVEKKSVWIKELRNECLTNQLVNQLPIYNDVITKDRNKKKLSFCKFSKIKAIDKGDQFHVISLLIRTMILQFDLRRWRLSKSVFVRLPSLVLGVLSINQLRF